MKRKMMPDKMLRYLDNGYTMTREEQSEVAAYIRRLIESTKTLKLGLIKNAQPLPTRLPQQLELWTT